MFEDRRTIVNSSGEPLTVWLEPWGQDLQLASGQSLDLVARSPSEGRLEVVDADGAVAVYAWPEATIQAFRQNELIYDMNIAFPASALPAGMTARSFVEFMFGGPGGPAQS
jgi:hypothetical protein